MDEPKKLFTFEFICLNFICFFAFCNMSVFYSFFEYLGKISIPVEWRGFLLGLEPMSAFALRLAIIPWLHLGNAVGVMMLALTMLVAALCSYVWALTVPSLIALRIFHGAAFVLLISACMSLVVHLIPREKSAQGFGILSVTVLLPYAVMPSLSDTLLRYVSSEAHIYAGVTIMALPGMVLLEVLGRRLKSSSTALEGALAVRPSMADLRQNLKHFGVVLILVIGLLFSLSYASVFFFMKSFAQSAGLGQGGMFFTIATLVMIAVRVLGGTVFDKLDKVRMLRIFAVQLMLCFILFGFVRSTQTLYILAAYYGLCVGVFMPLLSATLFLASPARLRGLNTNLSLSMMDAGFFLSPYLGGMLIVAGFSFSTLFSICAGFLATILVLLLVLGRQQVFEPAQSHSIS
jgi:MFS family permease